MSIRPALRTLSIAVVTGLSLCTASASAAPGDFAWPLHPKPRIVTPFAPPAQDWLPGHRGVDLAGDDGLPVLAVADGTVVLDFNRAVNFPAAFSAWATCPRPPAANHLAAAIRAGEKRVTRTER